MLYDSHTHLNSPQLFPKYEEYLKRFLDNNGAKLVNVGVDKDRTEKAILIKNNYPDFCLATGGFHPSEVLIKQKNNRFFFEYKKENLTWEEYLEEVEKYLSILAENKDIVAIGECGLDYHYKENGNNLSNKSKERQKELFILQIKIAQKYDLPLVIHSRDAFEDTIEILKDFKELKIYFHCWGYGPNEIKIIEDLFPNLWVGFDGNISYPKAQALRDSIKTISKDKILLETDAPYLAPQIIRGQQNEPVNIKYIYEYVSNLLKIDQKDLEDIIEDNFIRLYNTVESGK